MRGIFSRVAIFPQFKFLSSFHSPKMQKMKVNKVGFLSSFDSEKYSQHALNLLHDSHLINHAEILTKGIKFHAQIDNRTNFLSQEFVGHWTNPLRNEIKNYIMENILKTDNSIFQVAVHPWINLGKQMRPLILFLLAQYLINPDSEKQASFSSEYPELHESIIRFCGCIEIVHNTSLLQDDIIDEADIRRSQPTAHKVYGISQTVFATLFLLARAYIYYYPRFAYSTKKLSATENIQITKIYSLILLNLVEGEMTQGIKMNYKDLDSAFKTYISKTFSKTASLLSLGCKGIGVLCKEEERTLNLLSEFGAHFGLAFQIMDDILDLLPVISSKNGDELGKPLMNDIKTGLTTSSLLFSMAEGKENKEHSILANELKVLAKRKYKKIGDVDRAHEILGMTNGIRNSYILALEHLNSSFHILDQIPTGTEGGERSEIYMQLLKSYTYSVIPKLFLDQI